MVVELAQVVVVPFIVQNWKDAAAGQLWQILDGDKISFRGQFCFFYLNKICNI